MSLSRENVRTDGRTDGWTDPILYDPSSQGRGSNKETKVKKNIKKISV